MLSDPGLREPGLREIPVLETYYRDTDCINTSLIEKTNCHLKSNTEQIFFTVRSLLKCLQIKRKKSVFSIEKKYPVIKLIDKNKLILPNR